MGTFEKVRDITVEQLSVDADEVKMESAFIDDLGADSLDIVELIMAFEEEFGVEIPDEKAEKIRTVADAVEMLEGEAVCTDTHGNTTGHVSMENVAMGAANVAMNVAKKAFDNYKKDVERIQKK